MLLNQDSKSSNNWFSLIEILNRPEEFMEVGKVIKYQHDYETKQLRVTTNKLFFMDQLCTMFTIQDITHLYEL